MNKNDWSAIEDVKLFCPTLRKKYRILEIRAEGFDKESINYVFLTNDVKITEKAIIGEINDLAEHMGKITGQKRQISIQLYDKKCPILNGLPRVDSFAEKSNLIKQQRTTALTITLFYMLLFFGVAYNIFRNLLWLPAADHHLLEPAIISLIITMVVSIAFHLIIKKAVLASDNLKITKKIMVLCWCLVVAVVVILLFMGIRLDGWFTHALVGISGFILGFSLISLYSIWQKENGLKHYFDFIILGISAVILASSITLWSVDFAPFLMEIITFTFVVIMVSVIINIGIKLYDKWDRRIRWK